jgi:hypothetical protein
MSWRGDERLSIDIAAISRITKIAAVARPA